MGSPSSAHSRGTKIIKVFAIAILALSLPLIERSGELLERGECGTVAGIGVFLSQTGLLYQRLAAAGYRKPRSHWVTIILLKKDRDPEDVLSNICRQRLYLAKLLKSVQIANPALVVIDKYFSQGSCLDESVNQALRESFLASRVPIIVGLHTQTRQDFEEAHAGKLTDLQRAGFDAACLYLTPALRLDQPGSTSRIRYGLIRLNRDMRKLPLQWTAHLSEEDVGEKIPQTLPTLSVVAASEFDTTPAGRERIEHLQKRDTHPFTSFIPRSEIPTYSALDLMCDTRKVSAVRWDACQPPEASVYAMNGRVVMIGEDVPGQDQHDTDIGRVPGVLLQANYLESILDDRYLDPVPLVVAVPTALVWLALIEFLFWKIHTPELALLFALFLTGILWVLCYLLAALTGSFLSIWLPGIFYFLARWMVSRGHKLLSAHG